MSREACLRSRLLLEYVFDSGNGTDRDKRAPKNNVLFSCRLLVFPFFFEIFFCTLARLFGILM